MSRTKGYSPRGKQAKRQNRHGTVPPEKAKYARGLQHRTRRPKLQPLF